MDTGYSGILTLPTSLVILTDDGTLLGHCFSNLAIARSKNLFVDVW